MDFHVRLKNIFARFAYGESALKHVMIIAGGTLVAQGLTVASMPVLSRIYSPSDFGVLAVFSSVIAILNQLSGFRYHFAIPLPKMNRYANALVALSLCLQIIFVFLLSILIFFFGEAILEKLSLTKLTPYRWLIPAGLLGIGAYTVLTQWAIRGKFFAVIGRTKISQCVSGAATKILLGIWGFRPLGLLLGTVIAQAGGISTLILPLLRNKTKLDLPKIEEIRRVLLRYRKFPLFSMWGALLNTLSINIMPVLLAVFYDAKIAGLYGMAQHILQMPMYFLGQAIGQVFLQRASTAKYEGQLARVSLDSFSALIRTGSTAVLALGFFSPWIFSFVLGEQWWEAGEISRMLALYMSVNFAYSPLSRLFSILDKQDFFLLAEILRIASLALPLFFWGKTFSPLTMIFIVSILNCCFAFVFCVFLLNKAGNSLSAILKLFLKFYFPFIFLYLSALFLASI